jgi:outer membrane lipoprotein-sorting protein
MSPRSRRPTLARSKAAALMATVAFVLVGCGGATAGPETGADVEDIQDETTDESVPFHRDIETFVGQEVTVSAEVREIISPNAFTIADENAEPLLVVYDGSAQITVDTPIQVTGTVHRTFVPPAAEEFADFQRAPFANFNGEPCIEATTIETGVDFGNE